LRRFIPIVSWLPQYQKVWLSRDVIAGLTIWGLLIPEMIAYAGLAGLPPQAGLYTLLASLTLYAIFGTSKQLVVAGTSASAVLVYSAVTALAPQDAAHYGELAAAVVILAGLCLVVSGFLRLGFITQFLSRPVMEGFVFGLAIFVTVGQLPKIFGIDKGDGDTFRQLAHLIDSAGSTSGVTMLIGVAALIMLFGLERFAPRIPGGLVVLAAGIAVSSIFDLSNHGVATVGKIPTGLPTVTVPHVQLSELWVLIPSAIGMMLVIFSEALGAGQTFADKHQYRIDPNQEMIALGVANIGSGLLGGLASGGSLSQTAVNDGAGARSEMSPLVATVLSVITVIALTPLFKNLPEAVLGALIIHAVSHLMKVREMRTFYRLAPQEFWLGMLTLSSVLALDVLPALIIGVVTSIILLVYRASRPRVSVLGHNPALPGAFLDIGRHPEAMPIPGLLVVRPVAPLFYANAQAVVDAIEEHVATAVDRPTAVIIDIDASDEIDITSAEQLNKLAENLERERIPLALAHAHQPTLTLARRAGLLTKVGDDHVFPNVQAAVAWAQSQHS
jgi:sulfate permease, SulP family